MKNTLCTEFVTYKKMQLYNALKFEPQAPEHKSKVANICSRVIILWQMSQPIMSVRCPSPVELASSIFQRFTFKIYRIVTSEPAHQYEEFLTAQKRKCWLVLLSIGPILWNGRREIQLWCLFNAIWRWRSLSYDDFTAMNKISTSNLLENSKTLREI